MSGPDRVEELRALLSGEPSKAILADIGTSTVTGVRAPGAPDLAKSVRSVGHPVLQTLTLSATDCVEMGSDFARSGLVHRLPEVIDDSFLDPFGVEWLLVDGAFAPLKHPLGHADQWAVARHPKPIWPDVIQLPDPLLPGQPQPLVVADAPCPGLLETCFSLRGSWQFFSDLTENWRVANALLDWSLETVVAGYEQLLATPQVRPDVVLFGDDYGHHGGMFLSEVDFRTFVRPRLQTLFSRIRQLTTAPVCFHSCGAIRSILGDLGDLGVELLNLEYDAKDMALLDVRKALPASMILHGYTDMRALGSALQDGDRRSVAVLTSELAQSMPAIAAPADSLNSTEELLTVARTAAFIHALTETDIDQLRQIGPVSSVLDGAIKRAGQTAAPALKASCPTVVTAGQSGKAMYRDRDPQSTDAYAGRIQQRR